MKYKEINRIEDVEGEFHVTFVEGKKLISDSEYYINRALFSLLSFVILALIFMLFSGFNMFYIYFIVVFLIITIVMVSLGTAAKRKGKKECIKAIESSDQNNIKIKTTKDKRQFKFFKPVINDIKNTKNFVKNNTIKIKEFFKKSKEKRKNKAELNKQKDENKKI